MWRCDQNATLRLANKVFYNVCQISNCLTPSGGEAVVAEILLNRDVGGSHNMHRKLTKKLV